MILGEAGEVLFPGAHISTKFNFILEYLVLVESNQSFFFIFVGKCTTLAECSVCFAYASAQIRLMFCLEAMKPISGKLKNI